MSTEITTPWQEAPLGHSHTGEAAPKERPSLHENIQTDTVIIGGGLAGILTAYLLSKEGVSVVLLEKETIGSGVTSYTTAFLTKNIDTNISDLISYYGKPIASLVWKAHQEAIETIDHIIRQEQIDCDFMRCSNVTYAATDKEFASLEKDHEAAAKLGFSTSLAKDSRLGFPNRGYWEIPDQAKFHPLAFLYALAQKAEQQGARICEKTEATNVEKNKVQTATHTIRCKNVIVATYDPFNKPGETFLKKGMYRSYVLEARATKGRILEGIYEDMENPYHYFRVDRGETDDRIILGGEDHRKELPMDPEKMYGQLETYLATLIPKDEFTVVKKWYSGVLEPSDGLPLIGEYDEGQFVASAFSGNGMTYSMIAALIFKDLIGHNHNEFISVFDPKRSLKPKRLYRKGLDYTEELLGGAVKNVFKKKK